MFANQTAELELLIKARYPLIYIVSWDERRIEGMLRDIAAERRKRLFAWTVTEGILAIDTVQPTPVDPTAVSPMHALEHVVESREAAIFVFKDFHKFLVQDFMDGGSTDNVRIVRKLRDLAQALKTSEKTLVLLSPLMRLPPELEKEISVLDFALPSPEELDAALERVIRSARVRGVLNLKLQDEERERVLKAAQGLTITEAENVFAKSVVLRRAFDLDVIIAEKKQLIRKSGILEYTEPNEHINHVGGLAELKRWLKKRQLAFSERARQFGLPEPRGLLLLGVPGGGKSLVAKATANLWQLPLLRLDMGKVFSQMVGSSEENIRSALRTAETVAPCLDSASRITLADGSERTIQSIYDNPTLKELTVLGMDENFNIVPVYVKAVTRRPAPNLCELWLMHAHLRATCNHLHPTLQDGEIVWKRTDELGPGDYVAVPITIPTLAQERQMIGFVPPNMRIYHQEAIQYAKPEANTPQRRYAARRRGIAYVKIKELKNKCEFPPFRQARYFAWGKGGITDSTLPKLPETVNDDLGYLLGLIASDGYLGRKSRIGFINTNLELHNIFKNIVESQFGLTVKIRNSRTPEGESDLPGTTAQSVFTPCFVSYVDNILLKQVLKTIQNSLLSMPSSFVAAWLRGYFDGDGYISAPGLSPKIVLTSKVPKINILVRSALRRIGIRAPNPGSTNIEITGARTVGYFAAKIGSCHPEKKRRLEALDNDRTQWDADRSDLIPVGQLLRLARKDIGMPSHKFAATYPSRISCYERNVNLPSRFRLQSIVREMQTWAQERRISSSALDRLEKLVFSPIGWSKVMSVKPIDKPDYVYDLVCDGNHTFIANGVVTHNCVLWLDEIEKGLAGTVSSHRSDAGTAARVFGSFLVWLQEKTTPVFVIATSNNIHLLPPELLRKGRFDDIFFVDLPTQEEREEIFGIHLAKRRRDPNRFDLAGLAREVKGFSGAEIEQVIISGLYDAFDDGERELTEEDLRGAIAATVPLSRTMREQVNALRNWARTHARQASYDPQAQVAWATSS